MTNIYVHIDTTNNAVLARGLSTTDFTSGITHQPKNLLLLDPATSFGDFEPHTGLKIIRGLEEVTNYFQLRQKRTLQSRNDWIDFVDVAMLKELSPNEISELLYLGHTKGPLRSPFFYKLQNNFVYFENGGMISKVYHRYLEEFYQIVALRLAQVIEHRINEKRSIFKKNILIKPMDVSILRNLKNIFQDGVSFHIEHADFTSKDCRIPIYLVEDRFWSSDDKQQKEDLIAYICYHALDETWSVEVENDDLGYLIGQEAN